LDDVFDIRMLLGGPLVTLIDILSFLERLIRDSLALYI